MITLTLNNRNSKQMHRHCKQNCPQHSLFAKCLRRYQSSSSSSRKYQSSQKNSNLLTSDQLSGQKMKSKNAQVRIKETCMKSVQVFQEKKHKVNIIPQEIVKVKSQQIIQIQHNIQKLSLIIDKFKQGQKIMGSREEMHQFLSQNVQKQAKQQPINLFKAQQSIKSNKCHKTTEIEEKIDQNLDIQSQQKKQKSQNGEYFFKEKNQNNLYLTSVQQKRKQHDNNSDSKTTTGRNKQGKNMSKIHEKNQREEREEIQQGLQKQNDGKNMHDICQQKKGLLKNLNSLNYCMLTKFPNHRIFKELKKSLYYNEKPEKARVTSNGYDKLVQKRIPSLDIKSRRS